MTSANDASPSAETSGSVSHLIIVCCHAIWLGGPSNGLQEDEWAIEPFQRGETSTYPSHINAGLHILKQYPNSLLVFSGAATKALRGIPFCEGDSYLELARRLPSSAPHTHMKAECHATDSYQNLLFSILHFRRLTSHYPTHITIVSHAFKARRFMELHLPAIRFPEENVSYVGIDPPEHVTSKQSLDDGEEVNGYGVWKNDLYGVEDVLGKKRRDRGWMEETLGLVSQDLEDEVRQLILWRGGKSGVEVFRGELPWDNIIGGERLEGSGDRQPAVEDVGDD